MKTDIFSVDFLEYTSLSKCFGSVISNKVSVFEGNRAQMTSNKSTKAPERSKEKLRVWSFWFNTNFAVLTIKFPNKTLKNNWSKLTIQMSVGKAHLHSYIFIYRLLCWLNIIQQGAFFKTSCETENMLIVLNEYLNRFTLWNGNYYAKFKKSLAHAHVRLAKVSPHRPLFLSFLPWSNCYFWELTV